MITWNPTVRFVISDVDETIAPLYTQAEQGMVDELTQLLTDGGIGLLLITGQGLQSVKMRVIDRLPRKAKAQVLASTCSGVELWGFSETFSGEPTLIYSLYNEALTEKEKQLWRSLVQKGLAEFSLVTYPTMPIPEFHLQSGFSSKAVMLDDRNSQITLEFGNQQEVNVELRLAVRGWFQHAFEVFSLPIEARLAGEFALDLVLRGVSKKVPISHLLSNRDSLANLGLPEDVLRSPMSLEIWGDRFSTIWGSDWHMSVAVPHEVRSISFRDEDVTEFPHGYNIVLWDGQNKLQDGVLEYLRSRKS